MGVLDAFRFVLISIAGWMNQQQQQAIEYLREENKVLREQLGGCRLRFTKSNQRRNVVRSRAAGQTGGTRYQPFSCSSKIPLLTSSRTCSASSSVSHSGSRYIVGSSRRLQFPFNGRLCSDEHLRHQDV